MALGALLVHSALKKNLTSKTFGLGDEILRGATPGLPICRHTGLIRYGVVFCLQNSGYTLALYRELPSRHPTSYSPVPMGRSEAWFNALFFTRSQHSGSLLKNIDAYSSHHRIEDIFLILPKPRLGSNGKAVFLGPIGKYFAKC